MQGVTPHPNPWRTVFPGTGAPEIATTGISEEHLATAIEALCVALQLAAERGQRCKVGGACHRHQYIGILRVRFVSRQRANEGDADDPREMAGRAYERKHLDEQLDTERWRGVC
jgi:hypothetical protein